MKFPSIAEIGKGVKRAVARFPFVSILLVVMTVIGMLLVDNGYSNTTEEILFKMLLVGAIAVPLMLSATLYMEGRGKDYTTSVSVQAIALILTSGLYFMLLGDLNGGTAILFLTLISAVLCAFFVAPFVGKKNHDHFWRFIEIVGLRIVSAGIYFGAMYLGLLIALMAAGSLFNWSWNPEDFLFRLWIFFVGILVSHYILAGIPRGKEELEERKDSASVKMFGQYILLTLFAVYMVILYIYSGDILISGEWPEGVLAYMIIGFSSVGVLAGLALFPAGFAGTKWVKKATRVIYLAILPMTGMLFWAVQKRIADYGVTERRYFVVAFGVWLIVIALYYIFSKMQNPKVLFYSLGLFLLVVSFGPWGARGLSERSQLNRLEEILVNNEVLVDGKVIVSDDIVLSDKDKTQVRSIVRYLSQYHDYSKLVPWFDNQITRDSDVQHVLKQLGFSDSDTNLYYDTVYDDAEENTWHHYEIQNPNPYVLDGYTTMSTFKWVRPDSGGLKDAFGVAYPHVVRFDPKENTLTLEEYDDEVFVLDLNALLESLISENGLDSGKVPSSDLTLEGEDSDVRLRIILTDILFDKHEDGLSVERMEGYLFRGMKK
ncbi:MAG: DUF4153 domain-containing protein [Candidatus Kerfeldbacteria bacterium]